MSTRRFFTCLLVLASTAIFLGCSSSTPSIPPEEKQKQLEKYKNERDNEWGRKQ